MVGLEYTATTTPSTVDIKVVVEVLMYKIGEDVEDSDYVRTNNK